MRSVVRTYWSVGVMIVSTVILSAAIIIYFSHAASEARVANARNDLELAAVTLMPYMISAVIAAITAIGVMSVLPWIRTRGLGYQLEARLREMAAGDLASRLHTTDSPPHLRSIANELNAAIETLGNQVAAWKVANRRQWEVLQRMRAAAADGDPAIVMQYVEEMEENWQKIAEFEESLAT